MEPLDITIDLMNMTAQHNKYTNSAFALADVHRD